MTLYEEALMMLDEAKRRVDALAVSDGAIEELIEEAVKRIQADHDALLCEWTTREETERIERLRHQQTVAWRQRDEHDPDWRDHGIA